MIKGRTVTNLDGDFKKSHPEHGSSSYRDEKGNWTVTRFGPRYVHVYAVTEFDAEGERWLLEHAEQA